jgi:hypothetical protein
MASINASNVLVCILSGLRLGLGLAARTSSKRANTRLVLNPQAVKV